jgi:hypothetical protein
MSEGTKTTIHKSGILRGYKVKYEDNDTLWYTVGNTFDSSKDPDDIGLCFDFKEEDVADMQNLLEILKKAEPDFIKKDKEYEAHQKKMEEKEKKLWFKILDDLEDIHISFSPFYWRLHSLFVSRPISSGKEKELHYKMCKGFYLGPLCITCGDRLAKFMGKFFKIKKS